MDQPIIELDIPQGKIASVTVKVLVVLYNLY